MLKGLSAILALMVFSVLIVSFLFPYPHVVTLCSGKNEMGRQQTRTPGLPTFSAHPRPNV